MKVSSNVEERRFSAASLVINNSGFSPGGRRLHHRDTFPAF
jgi:hypothetical protein